MSSISIAGYDFCDNKACLACKHVMAGEIVLAFLHDDEGDLHFSCGRNHDESEWMLVDIEDIVKLHKYLYRMPIVKIGSIAERLNAESAWSVLQNK